MTTKKKPAADDKILELLAKVQQQKDAIAEAERPVYKTNRTFSFADGNLNQAQNIAVVSDVSALVKMAAHVLSESRAYSEAALILGQEDVPAFAWCGFSSADWLHDIRLRINQIQIKAKREKLQALEERLDKIVSPERRRELEVLAIEKELAKA